VNTYQLGIKEASIALLLLLSACVEIPGVTWVSEPATATVDNPFFTAQLTPRCGGYGGCNSFSLIIRNKTDKNIEINWNKTLYVSDGQTSGGFMFEGVIYRERNNPKPPDVVFGNGTFSKVIWPNNLVHYSSGRYGGWENLRMPTGENGAYLSVVVDGKEISERIIVTLVQAQGR